VSIKKFCPHCNKVVERNHRHRNGSTRRQRKVRARALARDAYICAYCGGPATEADHVYPADRGGETSGQNMVACCSDCNKKKGARTPEEWQAAQVARRTSAC
jgi:5-methylcytosine-specific restriction endonuclease McrA